MLLTGQVFSGEGSWLMLEQENSVPSPISAKSCQASAIWCTLSGESINLVSWHRSSVINISSVGHAWKCGSEWVHHANNPVQFQSWETRQESCQECCLPQVVLLATFKSLIFILCCNVTSADLNQHYSVNTTKSTSLCIHTGLSASSLYPRGRHLLCVMTRTS